MALAMALAVALGICGTWYFARKMSEDPFLDLCAEAGQAYFEERVPLK